jgi:hypothetical protein
MIKLERGQAYPIPLSTNEGASAQFLIQSGSFLQVVLPGMDAKEETALRSGIMKIGVLAQGGAILLLFQFYGQNGKPLIELDAPFDARLIPGDLRYLPDIESIESRLAFEVHAVDELTVLRGIRFVTMPKETTIELLSAVQDQLASADDGLLTHQRWYQQDINQLTSMTTMRVCGQ